MPPTHTLWPPPSFFGRAPPHILQPPPHPMAPDAAHGDMPTHPLPRNTLPSIAQHHQGQQQTNTLAKCSQHIKHRSPPPPPTPLPPHPPLSTPIVRDMSHSDVGYLLYMTTPDVTFLNHKLCLMTDTIFIIGTTFLYILIIYSYSTTCVCLRSMQCKVYYYFYNITFVVTYWLPNSCMM